MPQDDLRAYLAGLKLGGEGGGLRLEEDIATKQAAAAKASQDQLLQQLIRGRAEAPTEPTAPVAPQLQEGQERPTLEQQGQMQQQQGAQAEALAQHQQAMQRYQKDKGIADLIGNKSFSIKGGQLTQLGSEPKTDSEGLTPALLYRMEEDARRRQEREKNKAVSGIKAVGKQMADPASMSAPIGAAEKAVQSDVAKEMFDPEGGIGPTALRWAPASWKGGFASVGESWGLLPEGSKQVMQDLASMSNILLKLRSGTAVNASEAIRNFQEQGLSAGTDHNLVARGVQKIKDGLREDIKNAKASATPEAYQAYIAELSQGPLKELVQGALTEEQTGQGGPNNNLRQSVTDDGLDNLSLEELRKLAGE